MQNSDKKSTVDEQEKSGQPNVLTPNINLEKGESNANSAGEKPGLSGGLGEPNINLEKGESNANSAGEKPGLSGGLVEPNINLEKGESNTNSAGENLD